jgi:hypothetical protein
MPDEESGLEGLVVPGLPLGLIRSAYEAAPGDESESGKFANPESSAALVANAFGFFLDKERLLPALPGLEECRWPATNIRLEALLRFPWSGGRYPCLDVLIQTGSHLIGVESKRYEPFRSKKDSSHWSDAYDRKVWGDKMGRYAHLRDSLKAGDILFARLDAAQLVKHAFGLRTVVHHDIDLAGKKPVLFYIYAEPRLWPDGRSIAPSDVLNHHHEAVRFAEFVAGDEVSFFSCTSRELIERWSSSRERAVHMHAEALVAKFDL